MRGGLNLVCVLIMYYSCDVRLSYLINQMAAILQDGGFVDWKTSFIKSWIYRQALLELILYFFANNHVNYARWRPIHLKYIIYIENLHSRMASEF